MYSLYVRVYNWAQEWNPFVILPLICKEFHDSCQLLLQRIFDIDPADKEDQTQTILNLLQSTQKLWEESRRLPLYRKPKRLAIQSAFSNLMSSQSLIQIYICAGYAKYFYTVDILNWICLDRLWITGSGDPVPRGFQPRHFKMAEDRMHRLFLPFNCAMKLCDLVQDDILAGPIADYLAKKAVTYGTEPVLLKYAQDLEMFMTRRTDLPLDIWNKLTKDSLGLIDNLRYNLLSNLQESGELVSKYRRPAQITKDSIKNTKIMDTLEATALADWGTDTDEIQEYAASIADDFATICDSTASDAEEHDEYFEQDGERILFSQI